MYTQVFKEIKKKAAPSPDPLDPPYPPDPYFGTLFYFFYILFRVVEPPY